MIGPINEKLLDMDSGALATSLTIVDWGILGDLLAFLVQLPADFHDTRRNDWYQ